MALTANRDVDHYIDQELRTFQVAADTRIFKGALVGLTSGGYARPLVAGDLFAGIAYEEGDNLGGADADQALRVYTIGDFGLTLPGAVAASMGRPVFAADDSTVTFSGINTSYVGIVQDVIAADEVIVRVDPLRRQIKTVTFEVSDLAAGADLAARAIHAFAAEAWIVGARVINAATAAAGIDNANTCVVQLAINAGAVASATFNASVAFPAPNTAHSLGAISNGHAQAGDILTLAVTNGATANPGPFQVGVDYL